MHSDKRGNGQNPPRTKLSRQKTSWQNPRTKPPDINPREQLRQNLYKGLLSGFLY